MDDVIVKVKIENLDNFIAALSQAPQIVGRQLQNAIEEAGILMERETKLNIRAGKQMWKPPIKTSAMVGRITTYVTSLKATVYSPQSYSVYVHEGTKFMQARPFFNITMQAEENNIQEIFRSRLDSAMNEIARRN